MSKSLKSAFVAIHTNDRLVFSFYDIKKRKLDIPGGKWAHGDRSIHDVAIRELQEEAGSQFTPEQFKTIRDAIRQSDYEVLHGHTALFIVNIGQKFKVARPYGWVALDDIRFGESKGYRKFLRKNQRIEVRFIMFRAAQILGKEAITEEPDYAFID